MHAGEPGQAAVPYPAAEGTIIDVILAGMLNAAYAVHGGALILTPTSSITDSTTAPELEGANDITIFESGGHTYAAVAAKEDDGVQILNVTNPSNITAAGSITDDSTLELEYAWGITTFESGGHTYAAVGAGNDNGVQILNITNPYNITAAGNIMDNSTLGLLGAGHIATFESGGSTYAAVAAYSDSAVQILDVTNPPTITAAGSITNSTSVNLEGANDIAIFESGGSTYAAVAAFLDHGVQILNITNPYNITAAGTITNSTEALLLGSHGIAIFESGGSTYAAVAANGAKGVQMLNITNPYKITAAGNITDSADAPELDGAIYIATFKSGAHTYAAVAAGNDRGVQMLDVTNPYNITAAGSIMNNPADLRGPNAITTFKSGGDTYAAVATEGDDGVQIIRIDTGESDSTPPQENHFVTTWKTSAANQTVTIPVHTGSTYNYTVIWDNDSTSTDVTGNAVHTYATAGDHEVRIYGTFPRIHLNNYADAPNLVSIDQWGSNPWTSMSNAFEGATNMIYMATDIPDLSGVTKMDIMFYNARAFNGNLSGWDVSKVTDMGSMFDSASAFNGDISGWNVSKVTDMNFMFAGSSFSQPLNDWNVSGVTNMGYMFNDADAFNGNISGWDVSGVTNMGYMFSNADAFTGNISGWNVSGVTNMARMFDGATAFTGNLSGWNVSGVADMSEMFEGATAFTGDISGWDVSGVTNMGSMFESASAFNGDISGWNVSKVTTMNLMFAGATAFNGDISGWDVSEVDAMINMFNGATLFQQNLGKWYVVPADTMYDATTNTLSVTTISAQNSPLNGHSPDYAIGIGGNSTLFNMTGSTLMFKATPSAGGYAVNVTAPGGNFGTNNHRVLEIEATGTILSSNANLGGLTISSGTLIPSFSSTTTGYAAGVANSVSQVTITPTASHGSATITVDGNPVTSGSGYTVTGLNVGDNSVVIVVTAQDSTTKTYTITVTRATTALSSNANLGGLTISSGTLIPSFSSTTTGYAAGVVNSVSQVTITPTASHGSATITVDGNPVTSGSGYAVTGLNVGSANTITIVVTAQDSTTKTYTITVTRAAPPPGTFTASIVPPASSPTNQDPVFDVTFGSAVLTEEFTADDVATSPRGLTVSVSGSDPNFSFTIDGAPDGRITAHIPAGAVSAGGDFNAASNRASVTVDKTDPRITSARASGSDTITVSFSEGVQGTTGASDWSLDGAPGVTVDSATGLPGGSVTLGLSGDLPEDRPELTLAYSGSGIQDLAGNPMDAVTDIAVRYPSSGRSQESSAPPVIDIGSVIKSYPQSVPEWVSQAAGARDPGTPIPSISVNGTFAFPLEINSSGYLLDGPASTLVPHVVAAGQPVTIKVTVHDPTPIAYFAAYLNLQGNDVSHLDSDAQIIWDYGQTYVIDQSGLMRDITVTMSEDPDDPTRNTFTVTVTLSESMGKTNMAIRTWNADGQLAGVQIFDALDVRAPELEPVVVDPEPAETEPVVVDPEPAAVDDSAGRDILEIRMWSGFEPESISDAQLLASLGLDYPGADIPAWVMTELGPLVAKGDVTAGEFKTALEYVLGNA